MAVFGYVGLCMAIYGYVWLYRVIQGSYVTLNHYTTGNTTYIIDTEISSRKIIRKMH